MEFYGIRGPRKIVPWNAMEFYKFPWNLAPSPIPWNSMESPYAGNKFHGIPWNNESVTELGAERNSMEFYGIFLGIPWKFSVEKYPIPKFHGIP